MLFIVGLLVGVFYVEILYRTIRRGYTSAYFTMPLRVFLFAFLLATLTMKGGLVQFLWLMGGFLSGFILQLIIRGWLKNGFVKLCRTAL